MLSWDLLPKTDYLRPCLPEPHHHIIPVDTEDSVALITQVVELVPGLVTAPTAESYDGNSSSSVWTSIRT